MPGPDGSDWRDPNMPVIVQCRREGKIVFEYWTPERMQRVMAARMQMPTPEPYWSVDPTYNLARKRR